MRAQLDNNASKSDGEASKHKREESWTTLALDEVQ